MTGLHWRWLGKGPTGWVRISPTHVTYPLRAIEKFIAECGAAEEHRPRPKERVHRVHDRQIETIGCERRSEGKRRKH